MPEKIETDDLDRDILNVLLEEGRKSFRQVAEEVGSTPATVINRVERLEEEGVVTGYSADLDYQRLGYDGLAAVEIVFQGESLSELKEQVKEHENVVTAYTITGDTDLLLLVKFRDRDELNSFVQEELSGSGNVDKTITHVALEVLKEGEEPPL
ncbi:MAG: Lrp/AsnC family transcriptional regulator [Candidatus Nanohaloarchaea archaeon]|nr:Lrp/AsnC family transcriptional regulator [Candidatus Nanohaloarchaea archaeon]